MHAPGMQTILRVRDYDLATTLTSGQAFRWRERDGGWEGAVAGRWVRLRQESDGIAAEAAAPQEDWRWLSDYLQSDLDLESVLLSFPDDDPMRAATASCRGLRLLRQDPWECLASFILSSTKQIVQIQQIVGLLCERFGTQLMSPPGREPAYSFPTAERLAAVTESALRDCKMGFRAPNLLRSARMIARREVDLEAIRSLELGKAREELLRLPGVGNK